MKTLLFWLVQCIWGWAQSAMGLILYLYNWDYNHYFYHGALVTEWKYYSAVSLGPFIFVPRRPGVPSRYRTKYTNEDIYNRLVVHEYGHCIQSLILGPLYLIVIGIPSFIWANIPALSRYRRNKQRSYYHFFTERWANYCGEKVTKQASMGQMFID